LPSPVTLEQTDSPASFEVAPDDQRLSYITRLLGAEPALNMVLLGALLFFVDLINWGWPSGWWTLLAALAWVAFLVGGLRIYLAAYDRWIPAYYQRRFGSVEPAPKPWSKWGARFFLAFVVLLFIGLPFGHYLEPVASRFLDQIHTMISDPARQINLAPSLVWMAGICGTLQMRIRTNIERRRLYFLLVGLVGFASIVFYPIWHPEAKQHMLWRVLNGGSLGLTFIASGLYDHISLVLLLPKRVAEGNDE
jgi:hypothetical protein